MYRRKLIAHKHMYSSILTSIKDTLYENSDETKEHGERMAILAKSLANALIVKQVLVPIERRHNEGQITNA
jgi:hypothetical protein